MADCMICIVHGEVRGAIACDTPWLSETLAEWGADPEVSEIIRVPVEVPRRLLFERWPGREAALALIAQAEQGAAHG